MEIEKTYVRRRSRLTSHSVYTTSSLPTSVPVNVVSVLPATRINLNTVERIMYNSRINSSW